MFLLLTLFGPAEESRPKHSAEPEACSDSRWEVGGPSAHLFLEEPTALFWQLNQLIVLCWLGPC